MIPNYIQPLPVHFQLLNDWLQPLQALPDILAPHKPFCGGVSAPLQKCLRRLPRGSLLSLTTCTFPPPNLCLSRLGTRLSILEAGPISLIKLALRKDKHHTPPPNNPSQRPGPDLV